MDKAFGKNHMRTVEEYLRFGIELSKVQRNKEAIKYFQIYIDRISLVLSPSDIKILNARMMIGSILNDEGRLDEAIEIYESVLSHLGENPENKELYFTVNLLLGTALKFKGNDQRAIKIYKEINEMADSVIHESHFNFVKLKCLYGQSLAEAGKMEQAFKILKFGTQLAKKYEMKFFELLMARHTFASLLVKLGYQGKAIEEMKELNQDIRRDFGEESLFYLKNTIDYANSLLRGQRFEEAESKLTMLKQFYEKKGLTNEADFCRVLLNLSATYFSLGQASKGKEIMYKLKDIVDEDIELSKEFAEVVNQMVHNMEERDDE